MCKPAPSDEFIFCTEKPIIDFFGLTHVKIEFIAFQKNFICS